MLFYCFFGMLAAFGAVCAAWILTGFFRKGRVTALCTGKSVKRGIWLLELGLVDKVIVLPEEGECAH